jgi:hypothetical protein
MVFIICIRAVQCNAVQANRIKSKSGAAAEWWCRFNIEQAYALQVQQMAGAAITVVRATLSNLNSHPINNLLTRPHPHTCASAVTALRSFSMRMGRNAGWNAISSSASNTCVQRVR